MSGRGITAATRSGARHSSSLTAQGVAAGYGGVDRLYEVTATFGPGIHLLLGHNGAGKTTLFRVLAGVLAPRSGRVALDGNDLHRDARVRERLALVGHRAASAPQLTVADNLDYWARILGLSRAEREQRIEAALTELGLDGIADQYVGRLSRGQTQRVSLAKAQLADPAVLLLDEPLSGLDPGASARMRAALREMGSSGRIILISAHELAEVTEIADEVAVLVGGRLHAHGPVEELYDQLVGRTSRLRIRGGPGLAAAVESHGYAVLERNEAGVTTTVPTRQAIHELIAALVHAGIGISEVGPLDNPLSEVYRSVGETRTGS